jgi:hypothetical protein
MKTSKYLALGFLVISLTPVFGQPTVTDFPRRQRPPIEVDPNTGLPIETTLTKFNLDFSGGTPAQLVKAIEKATGKPLNVIISDEDAAAQLPPLKMTDVVVPQLFAALEVASRKTIIVNVGQFGNVNYSQQQSSYGFKTPDNGTDNSIWFFYVDKPTLPPAVLTEKVCHFYSLDPYLKRGFTVDDITTAIQTGWKMAGVTSPPELDYHKETKLLIAFGEPDKLKTINDVLGTLPQLESTYWQNMNQNVFTLQQQVKELQNKVSAQTTNAVSEEKSGK